MSEVFMLASRSFCPAVMQLTPSNVQTLVAIELVFILTGMADHANPVRQFGLAWPKLAQPEVSGRNQDVIQGSDNCWHG